MSHTPYLRLVTANEGGDHSRTTDLGSSARAANTAAISAEDEAGDVLHCSWCGHEVKQPVYAEDNSRGDQPPLHRYCLALILTEYPLY